jgi:hypothetical protein
MNSDRVLSTPAAFKKLLVGLFVIVLAGVFFLVPKSRSTLSFFRAKNAIVSDNADLNFLSDYIRKELPKSVLPQFGFPINNHKGCKVYIVNDITGTDQGFQPFNALYDHQLDAIFLDYQLVNLAKHDVRDAGGKTLLCFVLLHELGHRTLHSGRSERYDFINFNTSSWSKSLADVLPFLQKKSATGLIHTQMEIEADRWAVEHFIEKLPKDSGGIFLKEPDSLPLMNLVEGGLLSAITQNGPYSPFQQGANHPSIFSRVVNFYYALSQTRTLFPKDNNFYAIEAMRLHKFVDNLKEYMTGVVMLDEGDLPMTCVVQGSDLYVGSWKKHLYRVTLPLKATQSGNIPEVLAHKTTVEIPDSLGDYQLFSDNHDLYLLSDTNNNIYRLDISRSKWNHFFSTNGDRNYLKDGQFYSYSYDQKKFAINVFRVDIADKRLALVKSYRCPGLISVDPYQFFSGEDGDYLTVYEENYRLKIYRFQNDKPALLQQFDKVNGFEIDDHSRYLQINHDRNNETVRNGFQVFYDNFARPYVLDISKPGALELTDFGPYTYTQDIFDLRGNCFLAKDMMLNSIVAQSDSTCAPKNRPHAEYSVLHSQYYTVLDNSGQIVMNDDYMRHPNVVTQFVFNGVDYTATDILGSRFLILFDFNHPRMSPLPYRITMHAVDL